MANNDQKPDAAAEETIKNYNATLTTLSEVCEATKTAAAEAVETQKAITEAHAQAQAKLEEIAATATQALAAQTQITAEQAVIATKSDHIQKAQEHADTVRAGLDRTLTAATQQATEAEGLKARAQSAADNSATVLAEIRAAKAAAEADAAAGLEARKSAEEAASVTQGLAEKAAVVETRVASYEKRLAELEVECATQLKTIEALLRGATSAGLAHAFDQRRQTFLKPHNRWQVVFVGSVLAIVVLTITGLWHVYHANTVPTYDELIRLWLARLPIAGALVWLALHASRESALAKRLEEDYGYKSAIASCFEGFRKQMADVGKDIDTESPLAKLCGDTLTTIATPPGRIYDKHALTVTPAADLAGSAKAVVEVAANAPKA